MISDMLFACHEVSCYHYHSYCTCSCVSSHCGGRYLPLYSRTTIPCAIAAPTVTSQAYGLNTGPMHQGMEERVYKFPSPEVDAESQAEYYVAYALDTDRIRCHC